MLPNYIVAGGQKCGITSLYSILNEHPEIFVPESNEIHFFDRENIYEKGKEFYESHFAKRQKEKIVMDITPNYMYSVEIPYRIKKILPDVKLIFLLRNPIKRAYSNYLQNVRLLAESDSFSIAIRKRSKYVVKSLYAYQIKKFLHFFPKENIKIFISEQMFANPRRFFQNFFDYLGVTMNEFVSFNRKENYARLPKHKIFESIVLSQNIFMKSIKRIVPHKVKK